MYEVFGEFNSFEEINMAAVGQKEEGDTKSLLVLAKENGIDKEVAELFIEDEIDCITDVEMAAIGKLDVEIEALKAEEIMIDWAEYIKSECLESEAMARAVRQKGKSLKGCIGKLLGWSFENAKTVDSAIVKAAGVNVSSCKLGIPGIARAKEIISAYYLG